MRSVNLLISYSVILFELFKWQKSESLIKNALSEIVIQMTKSKSLIKDATSVSFRSELFTSYILIIFKQRNLLP